MSDFKSKTRPSRAAARALILGASLSTIAVAGAAGAVRAQSNAEEACSAVMGLRSRFTVERVLREFPENDCVPIMLASIPPDLLARINPGLVEDLPTSQLRKIPRGVLEILGIDPRLGSARSVSNQYGY